MLTYSRYPKLKGPVFGPLLDDDSVNFRLTYDGPLLKAASSKKPRKDEKHQLRRFFHLQLLNLWNSKTILSDQLLKYETEEIGGLSVKRNSLLKWSSEKFRRGDFVFYPIVRSDLNLVCDLDIVFLRREEPGSIIRSGGDLDNRIKTLFDALKIPDKEEIEGYEPDEAERPLFLCLTENDNLITGFRVTSDRLLESKRKAYPFEFECPEAPEGAISVDNMLEEGTVQDVRLIINVEIAATKLTQENMGYFSRF